MQLLRVLIYKSKSKSECYECLLEKEMNQERTNDVEDPFCRIYWQVSSITRSF